MTARARYDGEEYVRVRRIGTRTWTWRVIGVGFLNLHWAKTGGQESTQQHALEVGLAALRRRADRAAAADVHRLREGSL